MGNMSAIEYYRHKKNTGSCILCRPMSNSTEEYDIIVIEGAGSPAEINLKSRRYCKYGNGKACRCAGNISWRH